MSGAQPFSHFSMEQQHIYDMYTQNTVFSSKSESNDEMTASCFAQTGTKYTFEIISVCINLINFLLQYFPVNLMYLIKVTII